MPISKQTVVKVLKELKKYHGSTMLSDFSKLGEFKILISTILSVRTKDEATIPASNALLKKYNTPKKLANARIKDVEKIIKKTGFYKTKARRVIKVSRILLDKYNSRVPKERHKLLELPGVGPKVAGCVRVYAHNLDSIPVDTHCHHLSNRLGWVKTKTPEKTETELEKIVPKPYWKWVNELFVYYGKQICTPISPWCSKCVIRRYCKRVGVMRSR